MFFVFKGNLLDFYFFLTAAGVKCCVVAVRPRTSHGADDIFISFGIIKPILITLKVEYRLSWC